MFAKGYGRMNNISVSSVEAYKPHWLHTGEQVWPLSNCYVDLWIEVLNTLELNPLASFAFTVAIDFEGDQWTFFKVPLHDLYRLYGIDVQELNIWHSLLEHIRLQASRGRLVLVEVDAFYLPDVSATSYRQQHEKTTIGVREIDPEHQHLSYFHNGGYYTLSGEDFAGIFQNELSSLPPYVEFAKLDAIQHRTDEELAELALELLREHLGHRPATNPFYGYRDSIQSYLAHVQEYSEEYFHKYAFATSRQYGASSEYAALFLRWLANYQPAWKEALQEAAAHFEEISNTAQVLLLKLARTARTKKLFDALPFLEGMADHWAQAMALLDVTR